MSPQRNQSVKNSARGVIINMNPKVVLKRLSGPHVKSLQKTPEQLHEVKSVKLELEILEFEENNFSSIFECPFCDYEAFSRMELLTEHVTSFHKITKTNKKTADVSMILRLLNISLTLLDYLNLDPTSASSGKPIITRKLFSHVANFSIFCDFQFLPKCELHS